MYPSVCAHFVWTHLGWYLVSLLTNIWSIKFWYGSFSKDVYQKWDIPHQNPKWLTFFLSTSTVSEGLSKWAKWCNMLKYFFYKWMKNNINAKKQHMDPQTYLYSTKYDPLHFHKITCITQRTMNGPYKPNHSLHPEQSTWSAETCIMCFCWCTQSNLTKNCSVSCFTFK